MSITKNSEIVISIASIDGVAAIASVNQFMEEPEVSVRRELIPGTPAMLGAFALLSAALQEEIDAESIAISMPSSIFPRVKEAYNSLAEEMDPEAVKQKVVKAWIRKDEPMLAEAIEEMVDVLASVKVPLVLTKNLNAFRYSLNGAEAAAAGVMNNMEVEFKNSVATINGKQVHVLGTKNFNGVAKISVRGKEFTRKNGAKEIDATVERNDKPDVALENLRLVINTAAGALNRVRKARVAAAK